MSKVRADKLVNRAGTGAVELTEGATVPATTDSTSTTTGALVVTGGVGVGKSLFVGGEVYVA